MCQPVVFFDLVYLGLRTSFTFYKKFDQEICVHNHKIERLRIEIVVEKNADA